MLTRKWDYGGKLWWSLGYIVGDPKNLKKKIREDIGSMRCQSLVPEIESFRINGVQWIMILWEEMSWERMVTWYSVIVFVFVFVFVFDFIFVFGYHTEEMS